MLLAMDIGNTDIVFGIVIGGSTRNQFRMASFPLKTSDEIGLFFLQMMEKHGLTLSHLNGAAICSVVPEQTSYAMRFVEDFLHQKPFVIHTGLSAPIQVNVDVPKELGADRFANAVAGFTKFGGPLIIIDFGSATTISVVTDSGGFIGGTIMPGLNTSAQALASKAAQLPFIHVAPPATLLGRNTVTAMQSGLFHGHLGAVSHLVAGLKSELGLAKPRVIATGGLAGVIAPFCPWIDAVEPFLTLDGISLLHRLSMDSERPAQ
ncbi:MAG TPA: type III pantothenate kinase [Candidatus Ozemobacteraceae bacterium]|nr:type III pantothenate kinase [Candidatus Ozemobacteraceae bacterium]